MEKLLIKAVVVSRGGGSFGSCSAWGKMTFMAKGFAWRRLGVKGNYTFFGDFESKMVACVHNHVCIKHEL